MKISIIIPVYNEEQFIIKLLNSVNEQKNKYELEIIIADDNSTDKTREILEENKKLYDKIIFKEKNEGKGSAIISALNHVTGDYILIQDADLEYSPNDYEKIFKPIEHGADVVYGSRFMGSEPKRVLYYTHKIANKILTTVTNLLTNINFTDIETGYKLIKTDIFKKLRLKEKSFAIEIEITLKLAKQNLKFFEVGISYNGRTYAEGKKITLKDGFIAIYKLFYYRFFSNLF